MKKFEALGVVETQYFTIAMELLDGMCKSSDVEFLTNENYLGGRLVTLIVGGSISDVSVAVNAAKQIAEGKENSPLKMALVITNPHAEIMKYIIPSEREPDLNPSEEASLEEEPKGKTRGRPKKTEDNN
ncbi:BMC domain-containing protein [Bacillus dakarensis]|uniref:BMC domain-containing protein n=1 Tax=Robertmurraya dakarensis TaxID=1926278 RepID=UPI000980F34E|nr:BMC domain-containing protein [Bacillus dakarensis]